MEAFDVDIIWSKHAIERAEQRFGGVAKMQVPTKLIQFIGARKELKDLIRVHVGHVAFVCVKEANGVVIITVADTRRDEKKARERKANIARAELVKELARLK